MWLRRRTDNPRKEGYLPRVCETAGLPTGSSAPASAHIAFLSLQALLIGSGVASYYDRIVGRALKKPAFFGLSLLNPSPVLPQAYMSKDRIPSDGRSRLPHRFSLLRAHKIGCLLIVGNLSYADDSGRTRSINN